MYFSTSTAKWKSVYRIKGIFMDGGAVLFVHHLYITNRRNLGYPDEELVLETSNSVVLFSK